MAAGDVHVFPQVSWGIEFGSIHDDPDTSMDGRDLTPATITAKKEEERDDVVDHARRLAQERNAKLVIHDVDGSVESTEDFT